MPSPLMLAGSLRSLITRRVNPSGRTCTSGVTSRVDPSASHTTWATDLAEDPVGLARVGAFAHAAPTRTSTTVRPLVATGPEYRCTVPFVLLNWIDAVRRIERREGCRVPGCIKTAHGRVTPVTLRRRASVWLWAQSGLLPSRVVRKCMHGQVGC